MNEVLTMSEIERRFDGEWVLLADPVYDESHEIVSGKVLLHAAEREEFDRLSLKRRVPHAAITYIGEMSEDMAVVL